MKTQNIHILPLNGDQNEYGRDMAITAESEIEAVAKAQDYAEKLGVGRARYSVSATRLASVTSRYETTGSAGRGYTLIRIA